MNDRPSYIDIAKCSNCKSMIIIKDREFCKRRREYIREIPIYESDGIHYATPDTMHCALIELFDELDEVTA